MQIIIIDLKPQQKEETSVINMKRRMAKEFEDFYKEYPEYAPRGVK